MKKINILVFLLILCFVQIQAKQVVSYTHTCPVIPSCEEGGIVIFTEGLTAEPIEMEFNGSFIKAFLLVEVRIYDAANQLVYFNAQSSKYINIDDFEAGPGQHLLEITLFGETQSVMF